VILSAGVGGADEAGRARFALGGSVHALPGDIAWASVSGAWLAPSTAVVDLVEGMRTATAARAPAWEARWFVGARWWRFEEDRGSSAFVSLLPVQGGIELAVLGKPSRRFPGSRIIGRLRGAALYTFTREEVGGAGEVEVGYQLPTSDGGPALRFTANVMIGALGAPGFLAIGSVRLGAEF
jgi:hypothetical protein